MKSNFLKHDPMNTITNYLERARANAEMKSRVQDVVDVAAEAALVDAMKFYETMNPQFPYAQYEELKVVFSVVTEYSQLRHDGKVQCMATKSTYKEAKRIADMPNIGMGRKRVIAQYVTKETIIGD